MPPCFPFLPYLFFCCCTATTTAFNRALSLEEKVALMDGRKLAAVPPSPTVLSVASSVVSGYSALGDSASQISAAPSRLSTPAAGDSTRGGGGARSTTAAGAKSNVPAAAPSCAGSATSSALVKIAALEKELAAAKSESAQLRAAAMVVGAPAVDGGEQGTRSVTKGGAEKPASVLKSVVG